MKKSLNIVIPIYNDQECVSIFYEEVQKVMDGMKDGVRWYLTFVEDESRDNTLLEIKKLESAYGAERIRYIANSRRFGKDASIYAGLKTSDADYTVVMDCDLQDPPSLIPEMIKAVEEEDYDCCATYRKDRKGEPFLRSAFSRLFYYIMNKSSTTKMKQGARDFRLMTRRYVNAVLALCERERFTKGIFTWVGFKTKWIPFENIERTVGITNMSFKSLSSDAIGAIISFTLAPLRVAIVGGIAVIFIALIYFIFTIVKTVIAGELYSGTDAIMVWLMFASGIIIFLLGITGEYLSRIYFETKRRPLYIIRETNIPGVDEIEE